MKRFRSTAHVPPTGFKKATDYKVDVPPYATEAYEALIKEAARLIKDPAGPQPIPEDAACMIDNIYERVLAIKNGSKGVGEDVWFYRTADEALNS